MAKTKISEFSATANSNTDINSINIAEGCAPSNINDAIRELMAELKDFQAGTKGDSFNGPVGTSTAAAGAFTTLSASSTVSGTGFSTYLASPPAIGGTAAAAGSFTTLTTSSTVTLNGGTANGVLYLNGSKVATSGSALYFDGTNLGVGTTSPSNFAGYATVGINGSTGGILDLFVGGTRTVTLVGTTAEASLRTLTNTPLAFYINSSEQMRLTSTGLGIGTSSPSQRLHVTGSSSATTVGTAATIQITSSTGLSAPAGDVYLQAVIDSATAGDRGTALVFQTGRTAGIAERARIDSLGNLGLGVTPSAWSGQTALQTNGGSLATSNTSTLNLTQNAFYNGTSWTRVNALAASMLQQSGGAFNFFTAGSSTAGSAISFTQAMTLDASGNLGIGTTSPTEKLQVNGSSVLFQNTSGAFDLKLYQNSRYDGRITVNSSGMEISQRQGLPLLFLTSDTERMRITSGGNLGLGTTSPSDYGAGFRMLAVSGSSTGIVQVLNSTDSVTTEIESESTRGAVGTRTNHPLVFKTNQTERARITSTGDLYINTTSAIDSAYKVQLYFASGGGITIKTGTNGDNAMGFRNSSGTSVGSIVINASSTAYNTSSDYRLKNTIAPMTGALAKVAQLKPCTYKWNADGSDGQGFIAHELQEVVPQCVTGEKDAVDAEGNPVYQGIDTSFLAATLTAAIQELKAEVDSLKAQLNKGA